MKYPQSTTSLLAMCSCLHPLILGVVLLAGCLVPGDKAVKPTPVNPTPATPLAAAIADGNKQSRLELSKLAATIAHEVRTNALSSEKQGEAWNSGSAEIGTKVDAEIGKAVKTALTSAKSPEEQAAAWDEIAKGYAQ